MSETTADSTARPVIYAVVASTFFVGFGGGVVFPILPNLGEVLGISAFMVGVILSANRWTRLVANGPAGVLVDRIGTRKPFVVGLAVEGLATVGYVIAIRSSMPELWFVLARVTWGVGSALVFATAYTITADVSEASSRGTSMGIVRAGITFGFPAGMVLGGIVSEVYSNATAFVLAASFAGLASVIAFFIVPETHVESADSSVETWDFETTLPALTVGLVNFGLYFAYIGVLFSTLVLYLEVESLTLSLELAGYGIDYGEQGTSGLLMAVSASSGAVFTISGGKISDAVGARMPVLLVFLATSCAGFAVLTVAPSLGAVVLACVLIGAGQGGVGGPLTALLADLTPEERMGRAMGTNNIFGDVGGGLGPLLSLPFADAVGFDVLYALSAIVPLLAGAVLVAGIYSYTGSLSPTVEDSVV
ncbi:MFS transporter [Natrinema salaciae]|uniref:MFS transporter n=1 Tax=Natrinema salaciae TaxID=1186196 RepID=UPI000B863BFD|nr:MFS transporter [Natrinema salaciae]